MSFILRYIMRSIMQTMSFVRQLYMPVPIVYPLQFPTTGFETIDSSYLVEEEQFDAYREGLYYPVTIGEIFASKYQVVGKLGFGTSSTVWLARDLQSERYVTLKIYTRGSSHDREARILKLVSEANPLHPGHRHVRTGLGQFTIEREGGDHLCLVQKPMWDSFADLLYRNETHRFTPALLKAGLRQVFLALDYLHTECRLVHTDIKADNILIDIEDTSIFEEFVRSELKEPCPRKTVNGDTIYVSRQFGIPKLLGKVVLGDLGEAVDGDQKRNHNAQPDVYRSPEVMLKAPWSYPADIWNVGTMIWDLFEDKHMFTGDDPEAKDYRTRAHLAEIMGMLGPAPLSLIQAGVRSPEFFSEDGHWTANVAITPSSLEESESFLEGDSKRAFIEFMKGMMQWKPEDRKTAGELFEDPWLTSRS